MNLREDIKSVKDLKARPVAVVDAVNRTRRPIIITQNGQARAVMQDVRSYESFQKAFLLLKFAAQGEAAVRRGRVVHQNELFSRLEKKIPLYAKAA